MSQDYVEVWLPNRQSSIVPLQGERVEIGRLPSNQIAFDDRAVSRRHAALERYSTGWGIHDVGSRAGTWVNGNRLMTEHALVSGDEIKVGPVRLIFRSDTISQSEETITVDDAPPRVTDREHDVLVALCRPLMTSEPFPQPATIKEMADELFLSPTAIKFHLGNLYDKFDIPESGHARRGHLANVAIRRGSVTMAELLPKRGPN